MTHPESALKWMSLAASIINTEAEARVRARAAIYLDDELEPSDLLRDIPSQAQEALDAGRDGDLHKMEALARALAVSALHAVALLMEERHR